MQQAQAKEIRYLIIFLSILFVVTFATWAVLEFGSKNSLVNVKTKNSFSNLAAQPDTSNEDVPLVDENFETYQFKDPFTPISLTSAPSENKQNTSTTTSSSTTTSTDTTSSTDSTSSTISSVNSPSTINENPVIIDFNKGKNPSAIIQSKGSTSTVSRGDYLGSLKVIDINPVMKTVELQNGDQIITITKEK